LTTTDIYYSFPTEDFSPSSKSDISDRNQNISALGKPKYTQPWGYPARLPPAPMPMYKGKLNLWNNYIEEIGNM
jgi:hypothetical protein